MITIEQLFKFIKNFFKDLAKVFMAIWTMALYVFIAFCIIWVLFGYRIWLADGDAKCAFANDPAVCAAVKNNQKD